MRTKSLDVSYDKRMKLVATNYSYCLFKKRFTMNLHFIYRKSE